MTDASPNDPLNPKPGTSIDSSVPHSARIWNYWLGGKDNYPVDREAGDQYCKVFPGIVDIARESRAFLVRAVRYLAGEAGIRQFLDIGTGLPTANNTHEVAQSVAPESRIVYVDHDPLVLAHANALLVSSPEGLTEYVHGDLHEPEVILEAARRILDFDRPIGLMLLNILGHIVDYDEARSIVKRLVDALPSGSHLAIADGTNVISEAFWRAQDDYNKSGAIPYILRSPQQITAFFDGLEILEPGVVSCPRWRPDPNELGTPQEVDEFCGVGRKP